MTLNDTITYYIFSIFCNHATVVRHIRALRILLFRDQKNSVLTLTVPTNTLQTFMSANLVTLSNLDSTIAILDKSTTHEIFEINLGSLYQKT